jgi:hypothetical protein
LSILHSRKKIIQKKKKFILQKKLQSRKFKVPLQSAASQSHRAGKRKRRRKRGGGRGSVRKNEKEKIERANGSQEKH